MNDLQTFTYNNSQVRTVEKNGEPWFVLKDVCDILGLGTPARVAERLDEDEVSLTHLTDSIGRKQEMTVISESGLYNVILRSDKPEAKPFRKWVTAEVLPAIRKTGVYSTPKAEKPSKTPAPEQLTLETSEYHYFPKTHRGEPVITTADFAHFTGINIDAARCFVKRYCKLGTDYYLLEREALAGFKMENPEMRRMCGALIVMTKSAVDKLVKYYNCVDKVPKLPEVRKIEPPAVEVEPSVTSREPKYVTTDEAIVALEVLRFIKNMSENHRQEYDASGDKRMVKRCTEDISAIGKAIKTVGMLVAAGY